MPKIPILAAPYKNVDEIALLEGGADLIDGYFDETGALNRRWGLWSWWSAKELAGVDGLFWWKDKQILIAVAAGRIFAFLNQTDAPVEVSSEAVRLLTNRRVHFAATESMCFMVNGDTIIQYNGGTGLAVRVPLDTVLHVPCGGLCIFGQRLLAFREGSQTVFVSDHIATGDTSITWKPTWLSIGSNTDAVTQLVAGWSELTIMGPYSTEIYYYTGTETTEEDIPFARLEGTGFERGCLARDSVIVALNSIWWMDQDRKIIQMSSRNPKVISTPIDRYLRALTRADDCRACQIDRWIVFVFPTDQVTWVFDTLTEAWMKWAYWNQETASYEAYLGQCSVYIPEWSRYFVGSRQESRILISHPNLVTDIFQPIRLQYRSAHFDHGTMQRKKSNRAFLRVKRGA